MVGVDRRAKFGRATLNVCVVDANRGVLAFKSRTRDEPG